MHCLHTLTLYIYSKHVLQSGNVGIYSEHVLQCRNVRTGNYIVTKFISILTPDSH